jgi:hypothetical protein
MRKTKSALAALAAGMWIAVATAHCGDDTVAALPSQDAALGPDGTTPVFEAGAADRMTPVFEAAVPKDAGIEGGGVLPRLLLSYNGTSQSELVAFGMASQAVDGRLVYDYPLGAAYVEPAAPWLLEQEPNPGQEGTEAVAKLDPLSPWVIGASWNVAMNDFADAGDAGYAQDYADPQAVLSVGTKAYVLRYTRNLVSILDTTQAGMGSMPSGSLDLSSELQAGGDGYVEPVAGVYVAAAKRVYVLLANINRFNVAENGYVLLCANTTPTVVAIDTTSDSLVDLNGTAPGHGWPLTGYSPFGSGSIAYDPHTGPSGRLLVLGAGCNQSESDGGVGPLVKRQVEALDLSTGHTTTLLDLTAAGFPQSLTYIDAHDAVVQLDTAYFWDPTTTTLGAAIPNAPDAFAFDGTVNLVGVKANYGADGGFAGYDVVSVDIFNGASSTLGTNPFTLTDGFVAGVALWPAP